MAASLYILGEPYTDSNFASVASGTTSLSSAISGLASSLSSTNSTQAKISTSLSSVASTQTNISTSLATFPTGFTSSVATTDATPTTLATVAVATNTSALVQANVVARRTGGALGTTGDAGGYILSGIAKNIAGVTTVVAQSVLFSGADQIGWVAVFAGSGANVLVTVTGAVSNNIDWSARGQTTTVT